MFNGNILKTQKFQLKSVHRNRTVWILPGKNWINKSYYKKLTFSNSGFVSVMLERRCRNLSKIFFSASFFDTLSNISLNAISDTDIFAETTSVLYFRLLIRYQKFLATDQYTFFFRHILFTAPMSTIVFFPKLRVR